MRFTVTSRDPCHRRPSFLTTDATISPRTPRCHKKRAASCTVEPVYVTRRPQS